MASDERATFSFGFFDGGPTTTAPAQPEAPAIPKDPPAEDRDGGDQGQGQGRAAAAEARLLTAFAAAADANADDAAPSPIEVAPGVTLLKGTVAGEAAAAALLQGGGGGGGATAAAAAAAATGRRREGREGTPAAPSDDAAERQRRLLADSDLVKGAYEGGFKLWEGALDLCAYLVAEEHGALLARLAARAAEEAADGAPPSCRRPRRRPHVLELGCGHGLPGLLCLLAGADVDFQDYNAEVLERLTRPNVEANLASAEALASVRRAVAGAAGAAVSGGDAEGQAAAAAAASPGRARYIAGDWSGLPALLRRLEKEEEEEEKEERGGGGGRDGEAGGEGRCRSPRAYDLVLTAETLYDAERGQAALLDALEAAVGPTPSAALVASKTHYFGVGGGTSAFRGLLLLLGGRGRVRGRGGGEGEKRPPLAVVEGRSTVLQDGASNRREVLWLDRSTASTS